MSSLRKGRVGRSSPKPTRKSNDETEKNAFVSKRRKIIPADPASGSDEDDDEHAEVQPAKKKNDRTLKKSPKKINNGGNMKEDTDEVELVVEEFSCPHCDKKFKSQPGCKYHVGEFLTYASIHTIFSVFYLNILTSCCCSQKKLD